MTDTTKAWSRILAAIEPTMSRPNFMTWLKPTHLLDEQGGVIKISVPNPYAKNWLEKHAYQELKRLLESELTEVTKIEFIVAKKEAKQPLSELPLLQSTEPAHEESQEPTAEQLGQFNKRYSFKTFIVGNNNRLAFAASQVVAEKPGEAYNPLFLYGGVGLGKTHLMQAIGNEVNLRYPKKKVVYTSCEIFTSEFIQALQTKTINEFKKKYRSIDVLLIDDIQFLANKEGTQEEFFHTFNILHQANRQIVLTSDRTPKEITELEDRLTSRFGWGMIADIQTPNLETRMAILQAKAEEKGFTIPGEVSEYMASVITSNVRELEGSLTKLSTAAEVDHQPLTKSYAVRILKDLAGSSKEKNLSSKQIIRGVAAHFGLETTDLLGKKRLKELVYPRQLTMYLLRELLEHSYPQIGEALGGKDHTTIMYGSNKIERLLKTEPQVEADLKAIRQELIR